MNRNTSKKKIAICVLLVAVMFIFILMPIIIVFFRAVVNEDGHLDFLGALKTIANSKNIETILNSLILGSVVVILSSLIALPLAFLLTRTCFARWKWLDIVLMIPFMTPPYISSMGWILFL